MGQQEILSFLKGLRTKGNHSFYRTQQIREMYMMETKQDVSSMSVWQQVNGLWKCGFLDLHIEWFGKRFFRAKL